MYMIRTMYNVMHDDILLGAGNLSTILRLLSYFFLNRAIHVYLVYI